MPYRPAVPLAEEPLELLGLHLRRSRRMSGFTQRRLEFRSTVNQTAIARLELARAPKSSVERLVLCGRVLGRNFPLGFCPHDHDCSWQPLRPIGRPTVLED